MRRFDSNKLKKTLLEVYKMFKTPVLLIVSNLLVIELLIYSANSTPNNVHLAELLKLDLFRFMLFGSCMGFVFAIYMILNLFVKIVLLDFIKGIFNRCL